MSQEETYDQTWNERLKGTPHQVPPPSKLNISEKLNSAGLYALKSYSQGSIVIKTKDHKEVVSLAGSDLSVKTTPEETLELIKEALAPYGYQIK